MLYNNKNILMKKPPILTEKFVSIRRVDKK